jgi:hypothetical protein
MEETQTRFIPRPNENRNGIKFFFFGTKKWYQVKNMFLSFIYNAHVF